MALKNSKRYQGEMMRNAGIFKIDQIELVPTSSAPSDSDLANSRFYADSDDGLTYVYDSARWNPIANNFQKVTSITATTTLTDNYAGVNVINATSSITLTLPAASTDSGLTLTFVNRSATGTNIKIVAAGSDGINSNGVVALQGTTGLDTQGDMIVLVADGSGTWYFASRYIQ